MPGNYMESIKKARAHAGLTQEQAAEAVDVSLESWKAYEYGLRVPPVAVAIRICEAMDAPWFALEHLRQVGGPLGVLPERITSVLEQALPELDRKLHGFAAPDAVLTAPETRSSSPVRILRDETRQSQLRGLYPCGEGAGYAGGITSAALDGILTAEAVIEAQKG